jgi:hypothetical protein
VNTESPSLIWDKINEIQRCVSLEVKRLEDIISKTHCIYLNNKPISTFSDIHDKDGKIDIKDVISLIETMKNGHIEHPFVFTELEKLQHYFEIINKNKTNPQ